MQISLKGIGKRFGREWIFKGIDKTLRVGYPLAITGPNGSGKSTLMLIISGWTLPTLGKVSYNRLGNQVKTDIIYRYIDFIAPYTELIEELTLDEFLSFHFKFKGLRNGLEIENLIEKARLQNDKDKYISHFSSGMKQRLKLALGIYSSCPVLLLDEPATNLDSDNKKWYIEEIKSILTNKIVIIASNQPEEYNFAVDFIDIINYK
jgi:ABC-type multidrug transport system ATPase subunit